MARSVFIYLRPHARPIILVRSLLSASSARMALPVSLRNTSSRLGRRNATDVTSTVSSRTSFGTNAAPSATSTLSTPSPVVGVTPAMAPMSGAATVSSAVVTVSLTRGGRAALDQLEGRSREHFAAMLGKLSLEELDTVHVAFQALRRAHEAQVAEYAKRHREVTA